MGGGSDAAWKAKVCDAADAAKRAATCCVAKAKCSQGTCQAGWKAKAGVPATQTCTSNVASCASDTNCCEKDLNKCGGQTGIACAYGFIDESKFWVTTGDSKTAQAIM